MSLTSRMKGKYALTPRQGRQIRRRVAILAAAIGLGLGSASARQTLEAAQNPLPGYCAVESAGAKVELVRPQVGDKMPFIDDVNWFARPVPNTSGHWIIAYASHNLNYLYDLTTGARIRIPDQSDAVATPDGRYMTVPSHYTATRTVNFYDLRPLLQRLERGEDASNVRPIFEHRDPDVADVYYQSVGIVSRRSQGDDEITVYRMMFSGARHPEPPGFRLVDYEVRQRKGGPTVVTPSAPMKLCPQIVKDMATPFISKDGRYVAAHDGSDPKRPASLKVFEITAVDPAGRTSTCEPRLDFGFAAGKADFSYDGSKLTFHISKHDYLTVFIDGGIRAPAITDVVVVDLVHDAAGRLIGHGGMTRVTTSQTEGVGSYFPAFLPDGRLFYIFNEAPKNSEGAKRYKFKVLDADADLRTANFFAVPRQRELAAAIGELWRSTCAPSMQPFKEGEAEWSFLSLTPGRCAQLVEARWSSSSASKSELIDVCNRRTPSDLSR